MLRKMEIKTKTRAYIQQPPVAEDAEQGVNVALAGEVETRADVAARRHHTTRVPERHGAGNDTREKSFGTKSKIIAVNTLTRFSVCLSGGVFYAHSGCSLLTASSSWVLCRSSWIFFIRGTQ